jgi:hypothetical protein
MAEFLTISADNATRALIDATLGKRLSDGFAPGERIPVEISGGSSFTLAERDYGSEAWDEQDDDRPVQDDDMLAHFVTFLRAATPEQYAESVAAAATGNSSGKVWSRLLGVGAERIPVLGAVLWPYATHPEFLRHSDTMRDSVRFVTEAYATRGKKVRELFERQALSFHVFEHDYDRRQWRQVLGRLLKLIPEALLATEEMRALWAELKAAHELEDNSPLSGPGASWGDHGAYYREMLEREGVDLKKGPEGATLEASDALHEQVGRTPTDSLSAALTALWADAVNLVALLDTHADALHERVSHAAWGHVANAVDRVAEAPAYAPSDAGMPSLQSLMNLLDRLSASPFPKVKEAT